MNKGFFVNFGEVTFWFEILYEEEVKSSRLNQKGSMASW